MHDVALPDHPTTRRLAVEADADPRSITAELLAARGLRPHVRGRAGTRVREVLARHGYLPAREREVEAA